MKIKGFSLIELMVVIAIIATLAAILLPALARAKARQAAILEQPTPRISFVEMPYHGGLSVYIVTDSVTSNEFLIIERGSCVTMQRLEMTQ